MCSFTNFFKVKDMKTIFLTWELHGGEPQTLIRHCHNCGGIARFADSGIRRHNANGKVIYEFAIYKCEKGHTWNRQLRLLKASQTFKKIAAIPEAKESRIDCVDAEALTQSGYEAIEISIIGSVSGVKPRLDKILTSGIENLSRSRIAKLIEGGKILVDDQRVKPGLPLREGHIITVTLQD